jgi:DNA-binding GntR family transcriptional regulator
MMDTKINTRKTGSSQASLASNAYDELKSRILRLIYAPGENLLEERLQDELKVSRTPIRMALSKLEQEGLVLHRPGRGHFIRDIRLDEIQSLYQVREFLEVPATKCATENASDRELKELQEFVHTMDASIVKHNYDIYLDQAVDFHYRIALMTKNDFLCEMVRGLNEKLSMVSRILLKSEIKLVRSHVEHNHILTKMMKRDGESAARLAKQHVIESSQRQLQLLQSKAELLTIALPRNKFRAAPKNS